MLNWRSKNSTRKSEWSEIEWQLRRWLFVNWLSGDFIVEQHVHNLDLLNWAMQGPPVQCMGMGGRQVRTGPQYGNIFDHLAVEYLYPNDVRIEYMGSQIDGVSNRNDLRLAGTKGKAYIDFAEAKIDGVNPFRYDGPSVKPNVQEYADLITSIREGKHINEGKRIAESTMTAIMGRMSAYTGRALKWDWVMNASKLKLGPDKMELGSFTMEPVAIPVKTTLR